MRIYKEISLRDFEAWSGAEDTMDTLKQLEEVTGENVFDTLEFCLDDMGEGMDETEVNDFLWFENDTIAEWLGYTDWEALERKANGEEAGEEIELLFAVGDWVSFNGDKAEIVGIDESDKEFPYRVRLWATEKEDWASVDEVEEWEEEE